jgi:hypothetical protein
MSITPENSENVYKSGKKLNTSKQWLLVLENYTSNQIHGAESFRTANTHSDTQEIPHLLWSPTIRWI